MNWFTTKMAAHQYRAITYRNNQAVIGYRDGREFVGPLATMPIGEVEEDDDGEEVYPADQDDLRRIHAVLALPMIAKLFGEILEGKHSIDAIHAKIQDICDVIEDTMELPVGLFEIGLSD